MEGTLGPRGPASEMAVGFHATPGGASLALGRPRYWLAVAAVAASVWVLAVVMFWGSTVSAGTGRPGAALGLELGTLVFVVLGLFLAGAVVLQSGRWLLAADEDGVQLRRTHRRTKRVAWSAVRRIQVGPTAIRMGQYGARLGDAIRIEAHHVVPAIFLDTVRFRLPAEEMDRMAVVLQEIGGRHGIRVEAFPMAGRETR